MDNKDLTDPTAVFLKAIRDDARTEGDIIANAHFKGDMAIVMGEVFGDMLANATIGSISNSLWNVPID